MDVEAVQPRILDRSVAVNGANWFFWIAILSALNTLAVYFLGISNTPVAFGVTQWIDGSTGPLANQVASPFSLASVAMDLMFAAAFAAFGYFARRGSDAIFLLGILLYVVDSLLSLGMRDFFGFSFHLVGLFFLFRGLMASRHVRENATTY
jgi:hypothetical protein